MLASDALSLFTEDLVATGTTGKLLKLTNICWHHMCQRVTKLPSVFPYNIYIYNRKYKLINPIPYRGCNNPILKDFPSSSEVGTTSDRDLLPEDFRRPGYKLPVRSRLGSSAAQQVPKYRSLGQPKGDFRHTKINLKHTIQMAY